MDMYYLPELWSSMNEEVSRNDPFAKVAERSNAHRDEHGCDTYPSTHDAPLVAAIAKAIGAKRILEVGCGLGYSALWLVNGAGPSARVETIEKDRSHRTLAAAAAEEQGYGKRIKILAGRGSTVLRGLKGPYDMIFADGDIGDYKKDLVHFSRLLRAGGVLASANLFLDQVHPEMRGAKTLSEYRKRINDHRVWFTAIVPLTVGLAVSVRQR